MWSTLREMVATQANQFGRHAAILAPGRDPLTFARLQQQVEETFARLRELGVGRGDLVASVLPNGPDAGAAVLGVSSCATIVPINPDAQRAEYEWLFRELSPKILLAAGAAPAAREAARTANVPVIDVIPKAEAGAFALHAEMRTRISGSGEFAVRGDIAYIVATSGSTARPKLAPLTHRIVCATIASLVDVLALTPADRGLNFSPLFHVLGLHGGLLAPIGSGGSAVLTSGFHALDFFQWLDQFQPTWFSAVPAILQTIMDHADRYESVLESAPIRFVRTGGAPVPSALVDRVESVFGAPLLHVYGMSEAPVITADRYSSPRRAGSTGRPCSGEVAIVDGEARPLAPGETGEIVVRGPRVIDGYFRNPEATRRAFRNGWFYTGDTGYLDDGGYLFLTGRASEWINRGGEKIAPLEIEEALLAHPAVAEALAFAAPDPRLGQEIAAAIVLRSGAAATAYDLQAFVSARLAAHKLPRRIVFLSALPVGATGKTRRSQMVEYLTPSEGSDHGQPQQQGPRDERERKIAELFAQVLRVESVGLHDDFFDLGGDSLRAVECAELLREAFAVPALPAGVLLYAPTVARLSAIVGSPALAGSEDIQPIQTQGHGLALFLVAPGFEMLKLARHLGPDQRLFGVPCPAAANPSTPRSIEQIAAGSVSVLRRFQPAGPYALAGWCIAGVVALEMARQLDQQGDQVAFVALLDARDMVLPPLTPSKRLWVRFWRRLQRLSYIAGRLGQGSWRRMRERWAWRRFAAGDETYSALRSYQPEPWSGRMLHIWAAQRPRGRYCDPAFVWNHVAPDGFVLHEVPGNHLSMFEEPNVTALAAVLRAELDRAQSLRARSAQA